MKNSKPHFDGLHRSARNRWVAVGDASRFVIFKKELGKPLVEVEKFTNESAHATVSDLGAHDPRAEATEKFLRTVADFLNRASEEQAFDNLALVMNGRLLGVLRPLLHNKAASLVSEEYSKDFAWISGPALANRVELLLAWAPGE